MLNAFTEALITFVGPLDFCQILKLSKFVLALLEIQVAQREEEIAVRCEWLKRAALGKRRQVGGRVSGVSWVHSRTKLNLVRHVAFLLHSLRTAHI